MNERSIVAAILASGVIPTLLQSGANQSSAVQQALSVYQLLIGQMAQANLPPRQP